MKGLCRFLFMAMPILLGLLPAAEAGEGKIKVFVSIAPQKYFTEKVGGSLVDVSVMAPPGASPAVYEPKPRQIGALAGAEIYFSIGVPFESAWLGKMLATNPKMLLVKTDEDIEKMPMREYGAPETGAPDLVRGHEHEILDPHIWTSPPLVKVQAANILKGLLIADPTHRVQFEEGHRNFLSEINRLDGELRKIFAGSQGRAFVVFHPSWGYFARAYGLEQIAVEMEGKAPKPAQLKSLIEYARKKGVRIIFAQPEFSAKSAKTIARAVGGKVVFVSPLAEDWENNLKKAAEAFRSALR